MYILFANKSLKLKWFSGMVCVDNFDDSEFNLHSGDCFSFTLYSAHSRVGGENLVLRHSVSNFQRILEALRIEWRNTTAFFHDTRAKKLKYEFK